MTTALVLLSSVFVLVLLAMLGLGLGTLLKKRTPLRGSCRGVACEHGGPHQGDGGCLCAESGRRDETGSTL